MRHHVRDEHESEMHPPTKHLPVRTDHLVGGITEFVCSVENQ